MSFDNRHDAARPRPPYKPPYKSPSRPARPKVARWSHQRELEGMKGHKIRIHLPDEGWVGGVLVEADQFTIKMQFDPEMTPVIYFKSAIDAFQRVNG